MKFYLDFRETDPVDLDEDYPIAGIFSNKSKDDDHFIIQDSQIILNGKNIGRVYHIRNPEQMSQALGSDLDESIEMILIETDDWHIIPIENLIAKFSSQSIELIASASTPEEVRLISNILEIGVDGCLLQPSNQYTFDQLIQAGLEEINQLELVELEVSSVERMGSGDRVCVDTASILKQGEGLLVGSTSAVMTLVQAEVEEAGFVNSRPFRINAGVVSSYTLIDEKTNYLSELQAGSAVMIVNREGFTREEKVARVKIERRPLVLVKVKYENKEYPIVLQDAETVKLVTKDGAQRVDKLDEGTMILCKISEKGRHFGMEIDEFIEER